MARKITPKRGQKGDGYILTLSTLCFLIIVVQISKKQTKESVGWSPLFILKLFTSRGGQNSVVISTPSNGKTNRLKKGVKKTLFTAKKPQGEVEMGQRHSAADWSVTILNSTLFCLDIGVHFNYCRLWHHKFFYRHQDNFFCNPRWNCNVQLDKSLRIVR